jgi:hypothetical protein
MDIHSHESNLPRGTVKNENHSPMSAPKPGRARKLKAANPNVVSFKKKDGTTVSFPRRKN